MDAMLNEMLSGIESSSKENVAPPSKTQGIESTKKKVDAYLQVMDELASRDVLFKPILNRL